MVPAVIDLTDSPEPEDQSPTRIAASVLKNFQPRQQKQSAPPHANNAASPSRQRLPASSPNRHPITDGSYGDPTPSGRTSTSYAQALSPKAALRSQPDDARSELRRIRAEQSGLQDSPGREHVDYEIPNGFKMPRGYDISQLSPQQSPPTAVYVSGRLLPQAPRPDVGRTSLDASILPYSTSPPTNGISQHRELIRANSPNGHAPTYGVPTSQSSFGRGLISEKEETDGRPSKRQRLDNVPRPAFSSNASQPPKPLLKSLANTPSDTTTGSALNDQPPQISYPGKKRSAAATLVSELDMAPSPQYNAWRAKLERQACSNSPHQSAVVARSRLSGLKERMPLMFNSVSTPRLFSSRDSNRSLSRSHLAADDVELNSIVDGGNLGSTLSGLHQVQLTAASSFSLSREISKVEGARSVAYQPAPSLPVLKSMDDVSSMHGIPYTREEDDLLLELKEVKNLPWHEIVPYFNGRTPGSIQVRYSSKLKGRSKQPSVRIPIQRSTSRFLEDHPDIDDTDQARRPKRRRNNEASIFNDLISWANVGKRGRLNETPAESDSEISLHQSTSVGQFASARAYPNPVSRILRQREYGDNFGRSWTPKSRSISDELKEHVFDDMGPRKYFKGTSSDVTCLAWAPDGKRFAAGSIAITDDSSMQYNKPYNLLLGDYNRSLLVELPEHHIPRPHVKESTEHVNALHSMRQTQDPRLFMTVASVQFSPDSRTLYSAGSDCKVRGYHFEKGVDHASPAYELQHPSVLDLMTVSNTGILATACHQSTDGCISVYNGKTKALSLSPSRVDSQIDRAIYPSALRWGTARYHANYLLAGFSIDSIDEERDMAGETCLWDIRTGQRVEVSSVTRNVFDVAWNPSPSAASAIFAVASTPGSKKVNRRTRSAVQCFAPSQNRAARVFEYECPAFDINDVIYCPYDENLIAVGATDCKVYIWDQRFANAGAQPLHILEHGDSLNVLDHDREKEVADTGIRFLSWGATSSRLYSGGSDGVVKLWNPYRAPKDAHVKDVVTFTSAVMSGAFSPDYCELLIGEDQGRLNSLSVGFGEKTVRGMDRFELLTRSAPQENANTDVLEGHAAARMLTDSGRIELRAMGALPVRQAVQGPNYSGPYLAPTAVEFQKAQHALAVSQDHQNEAHLRAQMQSTQNSDVESAVQDADRRVRQAWERVKALQDRLDDSAVLEPRATELQESLRIAKKAKKKHKKKLVKAGLFERHCNLDCNYLPPHVDDGGVPDSLRSQARMPTALWLTQDVDVATATADDLVDAGLTSKCATCLGPASQPRPEKRAQCLSCRRKSSGLTSSCEICASPIRPSMDTSRPNLCERCSFACFRCGKASIIARSVTHITCDSCELTWSVGALGYELINPSVNTEKKMLPQLAKAQVGTDASHDHGSDDFGIIDIERHASNWQTLG